MLVVKTHPTSSTTGSNLLDAKNSVAVTSYKPNFVRVAQNENETFHIDLLLLCYV